MVTSLRPPVQEILFFLHSKKNRKNKQQQNNAENDTTACDGAGSSCCEGPGESAVNNLTGNMNLIKLKKALDEMTKV